MPRSFGLSTVGVEFKGFRRSGITISVKDDNGEDINGSLRIGRRIFWKPRIRGQQLWVSRSWEELVDFLKGGTTSW
ncbi:hypothetical protein ES703_112134 [subsurface metagenome]